MYKMSRAEYFSLSNGTTVTEHKTEISYKVFLMINVEVSSILLFTVINRYTSDNNERNTNANFLER